ncbi:hypothetical protein [uncultured Nocardioides sp.]|uniref:hypothetical protein n=1 Tax=uncultured Nocardioides sp. TaxID=198441 RepID=UPI0025D097A7|nr:hypothetical protein [uncultured Nocardioides sp.]
MRKKKHSEQRPVVTSRAQLKANQDRVVGEFEALAGRLRGRLTTRRHAVQRLLHDTNQELSSTQVDLFTPELIHLLRRLENEVITAGEVQGDLKPVPCNASSAAIRPVAVRKRIGLRRP